MRRSPTALRKVSPLQDGAPLLANSEKSNFQKCAPGQSCNSQSHLRPKFAFNHRSALKVIRSNMYEPVSNKCVTTIISPKYANRNAFENVDKEYNRSELVPPEKPPRKNKLNKQLSRKESSEDKNVESKMKTGNGDACVDIDHINLEAQNYKNKQKKHTNASVQTSPLIPYRLRFWPRSDFKCDPDDNGCTKLRLTCLCRLLSQWLLSQIGLTLVVLSWALLGAFAFYKTEGPREIEQSHHLSKLKKDLSIELETELNQTDHHKEVWPNIIDKYLRKHEKLLLEAVSAGFGEGGGGSIWTYPGCILFAVSLLTTLATT